MARDRCVTAAAEATFIPASKVVTLKYKPPATPLPEAAPEILFSTIAGTGADFGKGEMHQRKDVFYVVTAGHADVMAGGVSLERFDLIEAGIAEQ